MRNHGLQWRLRVDVYEVENRSCGPAEPNRYPAKPNTIYCSMTLEEYLNAGSQGFPQDGGKGVPGEWMPVTSLTVSSGSLGG